MRARSSLLVVAAALGCVTSGQGDKMKADINQLKERVDAMDRRDAEINEQVMRLRKVLDDATAFLGRNSADLGTKVTKNEVELAAVMGQLEEAKHTLDDLQRKVNDQSSRLAAIDQTQTAIVNKVAPQIPEDKESLWREAQTRLNGGQRDEARRFFSAFIQRFPDDSRAPRAQILIGQSYTSDGNHNQAAAAFAKVVDKYKRAPEVPEAIWLLAQSYVELKYCGDARSLLQNLTSQYPRSPRANDAKVKLRELQRIAKDKRYCTS
jgi:tol-pal system protein YbgF